MKNTILLLGSISIVLCVNMTKAQNNNLLIFTSPLVKVTECRGNFDTLNCKNWNLNQDDVLKIFPEMEQVEAEEQYALCYTYPCYYTFDVKYKGKEYKAILNSGSYLQLFNKKEELYFIIRKENNRFLVPCDCCE